MMAGWSLQACKLVRCTPGTSPSSIGTACADDNPMSCIPIWKEKPLIMKLSSWDLAGCLGASKDLLELDSFFMNALGKSKPSTETSTWQYDSTLTKPTPTKPLPRYAGTVPSTHQDHRLLLIPVIEVSCDGLGAHCPETPTQSTPSLGKVIKSRNCQYNSYHFISEIPGQRLPQHHPLRFHDARPPHPTCIDGEIEVYGPLRYRTALELSHSSVICFFHELSMCFFNELAWPCFTKKD